MFEFLLSFLFPEGHCCRFSFYCYALPLLGVIVLAFNEVLDETGLICYFYYYGMFKPIAAVVTTAVAPAPTSFCKNF